MNAWKRLTRPKPDRLLSSVFSFYPFSEPAESPAAKNRCRRKYIITLGRIDKVAAAITDAAIV